jgi:hypothetical protein
MSSPTNQHRPSRIVANDNRINVAVAIEDGALDDLNEVAADCRARGLQIERKLAGVGVLVGSVLRRNLERLRGTPGVAAVEPERRIRLNGLVGSQSPE